MYTNVRHSLAGLRLRKLWLPRHQLLHPSVQCNLGSFERHKKAMQTDSLPPPHKTCPPLFHQRLFAAFKDGLDAVMRPATCAWDLLTRLTSCSQRSHVVSLNGTSGAGGVLCFPPKQHQQQGTLLKQTYPCTNFGFRTLRFLCGC